jgi:hypothetical protein
VPINIQAKDKNNKMNFLDYSDIGFQAFEYSLKQSETVTRKKEVIDQVLQHYRTRAESVLFVGFNPAALGMKNSSIYFTQVTSSAQAWLETQGNFTFLEWDDIVGNHSKFDLVVAVDEFLTFADTELDQQQNISKLCGLSKGVVITTLRDYKNLDFKDREFSTPALVRTENGSRIFLEHHEHDATDRNAWRRSVYQIENQQLQSYIGFQCRNMFFKQCAKFSIDAGARDFLVHNNIMYKGMIKKNYEHVISMRFDNGYSKSGR